LLHTHTRHAIAPAHANGMDTDQLRDPFLLDGLFQPGTVQLCYSHHDRLIVGAAVPDGAPLVIDHVAQTGTPSWLDRREAVVVNIGEPGQVQVGGESHALGRLDMLYVGMGAGSVTLAGQGARYYLLSAPAHRTFDTRTVTLDQAAKVELGSQGTANERVINQYVPPLVMPGCQIVVGMTRLATGSVWNTMPCHTHDRRSEAYLYLDLPDDHRVMHFMGEPTQSRHLVMADEQAVLSPPWSINSGAATASYAFVWRMAGDDIDDTDMGMDMDMVDMAELR